ncbi:protein AKNAD1 [Hippopotamus amphibius kiboko]|uniref:protein AKNAD1 n=1 Tax=Hippopotamus amphibius kiboko TaxID=575201 RepID=UPI002591655C|nr:protein AKNAD1 [Hippopotamus amphibius kiboko]
MDETDFLEDTISKQQEDLPYDGNFSQIQMYHDYNFTSKYDILDVSNQMNFTVDDPQEKATHREACRKARTAMTLDKATKNTVSKKYDKENQCTINLHIPANQGEPSKSNISDILLHHLCKEEFSKGQGINCETLPEISNADSFDEAIIKNIILQHIQNSWLTEQTSELTDQLNSKSYGENSNKPSCSPTKTEENTSDVEELVAAGESSHQENANFLTKINSPGDKQKSCQGQTPQKQLAEKACSGNRFKYGQGQVHYWFSDFSKVAPKVKISKNNIIDKPLTTDKQASFSPKLRDKSAVMQDISESMSRSNYAEKQEQKWKTTEPSEQIEVEPTVHIHQEHLAGIESETSLSKLPSTSQKDPSSSSSYIFHKISQGKQMCQKLKEQTDQLKTKVQEFSKSIAQDSPYHLQDRRLVLEKLQGHLELLEQQFLANKQKHLTLKQQVHKHESPAVEDFDPERKVEGEIFKLEMLLEDFKEKINKGKYTSAVSLPMSSSINLDDLSSTSSPPSNEEEPNNASGRQDPAETTRASCAFCHRVLEWEQKMEKEGHRGINHGRSPIAIQDKALHPDSAPGSDTGHSCYSASGTRLHSNKCENCGTKIHNSQRVCGKAPSKEFHYRYNTPEQNFFNHNERSAFAQLHYLKENKNSSLSHSKPKWICFQKANSKSSHGECEPGPGNSAPATPSPHSHSCRISGSTSSSNFSGIEETESQILNSSLDHALRTATILKQTTDQMIRTIAEDLAKLRRLRSRLKY